MKIEVGKSYRTRGGREVRIYAVDGTDFYPIHGATKFTQGWASTSWTIGGKHSHDSDSSSEDIILDEPTNIKLDALDLANYILSVMPSNPKAMEFLERWGK